MSTTVTELDWNAMRARLAALAKSSDEASLSPDAAEALLNERARTLAQVPVAPPGADEVLEIITFGVAGERFGLETRFVRTVVREVEITPVPGTPAFLAGVMNWRGEVLAIMNLNRLWGTTEHADNFAPWVLVLGTEREDFGLLADEVSEIHSLPLAELLAPASSGGASREFVHGVTAEALLVLDGAALLSDTRFMIDEAE